MAHRVFHTRVLPLISHLGLPRSLRARVEEACERLGGREGLLAKPGTAPRERERESSDGRRDTSTPSDRLRDEGSRRRRDVEYTRVNVEQKSRERRRMGYVG
jgi:hypothetical protein